MNEEFVFNGKCRNCAFAQSAVGRGFDSIYAQSPRVHPNSFCAEFKDMKHYKEKYSPSFD